MAAGSKWPFMSPIKRQRHAPARTVSELAEEFGLTRSQLAYEMGRSKVPRPRPLTGPCGQRVSHHNTYYNHADMRAWWKAHCAAKEKA